MYVPILLSAKDAFSITPHPCPQDSGSFLAWPIAERMPLKGYAPQSNTPAVASRNFWPVLSASRFLAFPQCHSSARFDNAVKELKLSLPGAPEANKNALDGYLKRLQAKEDINR